MWSTRTVAPPISAPGCCACSTPGSFADDPTRALRAARYAARLSLSLDEETERLLREADLATVSDSRVEAELRRAATEPDPSAVLALIHRWGLLSLGASDVELAGSALRLVSSEPWPSLATARDVVVASPATVRRGRRAGTAGSPRRPRPADGVEAAHGHDGMSCCPRPRHGRRVARRAT